MARPRTVTREDVDAVALDLFLDRGFAAVTGQQLATAAGISRPTLYRLVGRIEDIVLDSININTTLIISLRIIPTPFAGYAGLWGGI